jgi:serine/threonine protein kinase
MFNREVEALSVLTHPYIISLKGLSRINHYHCLWLEHIPHESLWEYIRTVPEDSVAEPEAMDIFYQLVCAVSYMHKSQISHHDLNSRNILINPATKQVKIIDFGLSVFVEQEGGLVDHGYGTPLYLPLEVLEGQCHEPLAVDVWSLGIILVEVLLQYHPFKMAKSMVDLALLIMNRRTCYPRKISRETLNIIDLMLTIDPEERIKIEKVQFNISKLGNNCGQRVD